MAAARQCVAMEADRFEGPRINVAFQGYGSGNQMVHQSVDFAAIQEKTFAGVIKHAWQERFLVPMANLHSRSKFAVSTSDVLAPKKTIATSDIEILLYETDAMDEALKPMWLFYEVENSYLAKARAFAADQRCSALKSKAQMASPPIVLSDTILARLMLDKLCSPFVKALGRSKTEQTAADGRLVGLIEEKLNMYLGAGGFERLRSDLEPILAARGAKRPAQGAETPGGEEIREAVRFGALAEVYLITFINDWRVNEDNRPERETLLTTIMEKAKNESNFDSSWWTRKQVNDKMKKLSWKLIQEAKKPRGPGLAGGGGGARAGDTGARAGETGAVDAGGVATGDGADAGPDAGAGEQDAAAAAGSPVVP